MCEELTRECLVAEQISGTSTFGIAKVSLVASVIKTLMFAEQETPTCTIARQKARLESCVVRHVV